MFKYVSAMLRVGIRIAPVPCKIEERPCHVLWSKPVRESSYGSRGDNRFTVPLKVPYPSNGVGGMSVLYEEVRPPHEVVLNHEGSCVTQSEGHVHQGDIPTPA